MRLIEISSIIIPPDRQRRLFDPEKLQELGDGIAKRGLLHPIILRPLNETHLALVAGERRLRAIADLALGETSITHDGAPVPLGFIPYTLFSDLDPIAAEEAEYEENAHRDNPTWQERTAAVARLASLRAAQAQARGEAPPTPTEIAVEVRGRSDGGYREGVRRQLIIASHLDNPAVKAAKTEDEAWKILKREEEQERSRELGDRVGRTFSAAQHRAVNADSLSWLVECPSESFDVILTDPPYGMGADEFGDSGRMNMAAHSYADNEETWGKCHTALLHHAMRITKPQAHLYIFCDIDRFHQIRDDFSAAGWWCFRTPLIWHKPNGARAPWPENGPHRKWECIFYAVKGKKPTRFLRSDVLSYSNEANQEHGAQKPVALYQDLLERSVQPGDAVLDPFCGTGPIFAAAHALKCRATGVEIDTASYGIAVKRIEGLKAQAELPL